ncbi:hypothetical protein WMY93_014742 [Mugilogobius chulae]|uniref:Ig-like domain-containing protein n=1 Tax=Mugilogobius chulae TaxID=88201 RepID=A0AAW0P040_9GOBI
MALEKKLVSFSLLLLMILLSQSLPTTITPNQPITVSVGSDVTLPCRLEPVKDLRNIVVEWARHDLTPRYVHIRRDGLDLLIDQNPLYMGRTALSESRLQKGDMTLSLTQVKLSDGGTYRCYIPQINFKAEVTLLVGKILTSQFLCSSVRGPSFSESDQRALGSPVLRCESRGWYPKPELEWLDSEGTVLLRTEAQKEASDELFSVSSRLSVEQKHGNTFTCRVRQKESGQTRETQLILTGETRETRLILTGETRETQLILTGETRGTQLILTDEFLESCASCSVAWILFGLGLVLAVGVTAAFIVWKFKPKSKIPQSKCTELEEMEKMVKNEESTNILNYLKNTVPELKENMEKTEYDMLYVDDVINKLTQTKSFIMKLKEKPQAAIHNMNTVIEAERKRVLSYFIFRGRQEEEKKKNIEKLLSERKIYENTIENLDYHIQTLEDVILESFKRKGQLEGELKQSMRLRKKEKRHMETESEQKTKEEESGIVQERQQCQTEAPSNRSQNTAGEDKPLIHS